MRKRLYEALAEVLIAGASGFLDELGRRLAARLVPDEEDGEEEDSDE